MWVKIAISMADSNSHHSPWRVCASILMFVKTGHFVHRCSSGEGRVVRYADDLEGDPRFPIVAFHDAGGRTFEITRPSASPLPELGTAVRVTYDPSDPGNAWASGTFTPWVIPSVVAVAGLGFVVAAVIMAIA